MTTMPYCGACGYDTTENVNDDALCDACGEDLTLHGFATGITIGSPGSFGSIPVPADFAALRHLNPDSEVFPPGTWLVLGDGSKASFQPEVGWIDAVPQYEPTGVVAGSPGSFTYDADVSGVDASLVDIPTDLANLIDWGFGGGGTGANPNAAWTSGQYVVLGDASKAHWDGTHWVAGIAGAADEPLVKPKASSTKTELVNWLFFNTGEAVGDLSELGKTELWDKINEALGGA